MAAKRVAATEPPMTTVGPLEIAYWGSFFLAAFFTGFSAAFDAAS